METPLLFCKRGGKGPKVLLCPARFVPKDLKGAQRARFKEERGGYGEGMVMLPARCASCVFLARCVRFWVEEGASQRAVARFLGVPLRRVRELLRQSEAKRSSR